MRSFIKIFLVGLLAYIFQFFLPWWTIVAAAFLVNLLIYTNGWRSFMSGFWGIFLLWTIAAFLIDIKECSVLPEKVAQIFQLPNSTVLLLAAALVGGLAGGFSGLSGSLLANIFRKKRRSDLYS